MLPSTAFLHIGHLCREKAHSEQQEIWPHGTKAMVASLSKQILHCLLSFSDLFSSTNDKSSENT